MSTASLVATGSPGVPRRLGRLLTDLVVRGHRRGVLGRAAAPVCGGTTGLDEVDLVWRSFELDASAPASTAEQGTYAERLATKYSCSVIMAQAMIDNMTAVAAREGLDFRFDLARPGNRFDGHRLLHLALERGRQDELKERLDRATFTEGSPVSDHAALRALTAQVGLPEAEVDAVLTSDRYSDAVRADEAQARAYGISAGGSAPSCEGDSCAV